MRKSLLTSLALILGAFLGLVAFGANATPVSVNLSACGGLASCSANNLTFNGLEFDNGAFTSANLDWKTNPNPVETGLGVTCNQMPPHNACGQNEIGSTPWQLIDVDLSQLTGFSSVTLVLGSVNNSSFPNGVPETAFLIGSTCNIPFPCTGILLGSYTYANGVAKATFNFTTAELAGLTNIWITPQVSNQSGFSNANILLTSFTINTVTSVPEPAVLGIFGLGVLMIGLFVGLRRRTH